MSSDLKIHALKSSIGRVEVRCVILQGRMTKGVIQQRVVSVQSLETLTCVRRLHDSSTWAVADKSALDYQDSVRREVIEL